MNSISVSGRLGKDGELKTIGQGTQVLNFSIADDVGFGDKKTTQWFNCAIFGKRAEALAKYLKKGMNVTAIGEFKVRQYQKNDGTQGHSLEINVDRLAMQSRVEQQQSAGGGFGDEPSFDNADEIPF